MKNKKFQLKNFRFPIFYFAIIFIWSCSDQRHEKIRTYLTTICDCTSITYTLDETDGGTVTYKMHNCKYKDDPDIGHDIMEHLSDKMPQVCRMKEKIVFIFDTDSDGNQSSERKFAFKNCFPTFEK